jgi:hypothetical protein
LLEWTDAEKAKGIEVLDLNYKEHVGAQQGVPEYEGKTYHICVRASKFMENVRGPINHTKLLRESGFKFTK